MTTNVRQPVNPEPFGRSLFSHTVITVVKFTVGKFLNFEEPRETECQTAHFFLLFCCCSSLKFIRNIQRKILKRFMGF